MLALVLTFLKANWKWICIMVAIVAAVAYVKVLHAEINHYKAKAIAAEAKYEDYKSSAEAMQAALKSSNQALTLQYKQTLIAANKAVEDRTQANQQRIIADEKLKAIVLSNHVVSVFNSTTTQQRDQPTGTVSSDDGPSSTTLADLIAQVNINSGNHLKCVEQVKEWQHFWTDFKNKTQAIGGSG